MYIDSISQCSSSAHATHFNKENHAIVYVILLTDKQKNSWVEVIEIKRYSVSSLSAISLAELSLL